MASIENMLNLQNLDSPAQVLTSTSALVGAGMGALVGNPVGGAAIGAGIGTVVGNFIPTYNHLRGSVQGVNFVTANLKPYLIRLIVPDQATEKVISDYYCYFGCRTNRQEYLNIAGYMYQNHAYVRGTLHYDSSQTVPLDKFQKIQAIFSRGVHILGA